MSAWVAAAVGLALALAVAIFMSGRGTVEQRFAAVQLASSLGVFILVLMTFVLDQSSSMDLALTLSLLSLPATLLFAVFLERWL